MLHSEGFPCLTVKAWNGRLLTIFIDKCFAAYIKAKEEAGSTVCAEVLNASLAARAICGWFDAVERAKRFLTQDEATTIYNFGMTFLKTYHRLSMMSVLSGVRRWKVIPKLHILMHLNEDAFHKRVNPRATHCFRDEDNVGLVKRLAIRVHKGPLFEYRILTRWLLRLGTWRPGSSG